MRWKDVALVAAWFGLACGLLESATLFGLQHFGWATWAMVRDGVGPPILLISPVFDLLLFSAVGVLWCVPLAIFRKRDWMPWVVGFFAWMSFYALLASTGRLSELASTLLGLGLATQAGLWFRRKPEMSLRCVRRTLPALALCVVLVAGVLGAGWLVGARTGEAVSEKTPRGDAPNVVLVVLDTLRADHVGVYGYSRDTTPNFDRLAKESVLFENVYASSSWTLPSHASMFTNLSNHENRVDPWFLDAKFLTLAEYLRERGYATAGFVANTYWCNRSTGIANGFRYHEDYFHNVPDMIARTLYGRKAMMAVLQLFGVYRNPAKKTAEEVNREFFAWLNHRPARPFFVFLNYYDLHEPVFPPAPYDNRFGAAEKINRRKPLDTHKTLPDPVPADRLAADKEAYDATIAYVDAQLGAMWQELERRGLAQNTLLIVTSDHGHSFGEAGVHGHRTSLRREQTQVPLIFRWPAKVPAGAHVAATVSQIHLPATVTDLLSMDPKFGAHSLAALWRGNARPEDLPPVLSELTRQPRAMPDAWLVSCGDLKSLVTAEWHFIQCAGGRAELFDLRADPAEQRNLAQTPEAQPVLAAFREQLDKVLHGSRMAAGAPVGKRQP